MWHNVMLSSSQMFYFCNFFIKPVSGSTWNVTNCDGIYSTWSSTRQNATVDSNLRPCSEISSQKRTHSSFQTIQIWLNGTLYLHFLCIVELPSYHMKVMVNLFPFIKQQSLNFMKLLRVCLFRYQQNLGSIVWSLPFFVAVGCSSSIPE